MHWDPYLHAWVVTRYADVVEVLHRFSAQRTPTPDKLAALGMEQLGPTEHVMVRQMLFLDPPQHSRVLDLARADNRHLAFGWAAHFCFGAPLARIEGQIAFSALLRRLPNLRLAPGPITWRSNLGLRGLTALPVTF